VPHETSSIFTLERPFREARQRLRSKLGGLDCSTWLSVDGLLGFPASSNVEDRGESFGNLLSIRLRTLRGVGHTQLWLGQGTWLHEYEWLPETQEGKVRSLTLRRYQPITRRTALGLAIGSASYDTRAADYTSAHANLNVTYSW